MWACPHCGCQGIAASLQFCPMCFEERKMPKATVSSGSSNAYEDAPESDSAPPDAAGVPAPAPEPEVQAAPEVAAPEPAPAPEPEPPPAPEAVQEPQEPPAPEPAAEAADPAPAQLAPVVPWYDDPAEVAKRARSWAANHGIVIPDGDDVPDYVIASFRKDVL